jgi:cobalt-zinc-cadmium efflux system protein
MLTNGWYYADPILSVVIGLFILPRTWKLLSETVEILLEGTPSNVNLVAGFEIHHVTVQVEGGGCPDETMHL